MSDFVTCPSCGARNSTDTVWCTMCFESLRPSEPEPAAQPTPPGVPESGAQPMTVRMEPPSESADVARPAVEAAVPAGEQRESTWTCATCREVNPISVDVCAVCGTTIFQTMGAQEDEVTLTQDQGLRLGLVPGLAHGRLGEPVLGFIIAVLVVACLAFAVVFIQSGGVVWGFVVGLIGLLTWATSIFDVNQRIAGANPILRPRVMTILGGVVILVIMVAGFVAGATAVQSPRS